MVSARELLARTGGHCPVHDDRKPSLSISERNGTVLVKCHAGCSQADVLAGLRGMGVVIGKEKRAPAAAQGEDDERCLEGRRLWSRSIPLRRTVGDIYFREHRKISVPLSPEAVRFLPYARTGLQVPALIVALRNEGNEVTAVQLTFLNRNTGRKLEVGRRRLERQTFGEQRASAVQLTPLRDDDKTLGIAEGTETALSAFELYKIPTWATLGAGRLWCVQVPKGIRRIHIFADNDTAGIEGARRAGNRYKALGFEVSISRPEYHADFNDLLRSAKT